MYLLHGNFFLLLIYLFVYISMDTWISVLESRHYFSLLLILMLKLSQIWTMETSFRFLLCPLTCPIIHRVYHYFLAQCSVLELLIMSLPHFRGFFRGPLEWRMTFSFQDLDVWRVYCYWVVTAPRFSLWAELENICMSHIYTQLYINNSDFTSISPISI